MRKNLAALALCMAAGLAASAANAAVVTAYYGDDDGFGVGATAGSMNPDTSNQGAGEAPLTDLRLISNAFIGACGPGECGPFAPTGGFGAFAVGGTITGAILTLRTGSFDSSPALDAPNRIFLDGLLVDPAFINGFSTAATDNVETRSFALDPSFFALLADGAVALLGTHLSEAAGSGSFQVDFMRLDITTADVPEPASVALMLAGLAGMRFSRKRKSA